MCRVLKRVFGAKGLFWKICLYRYFAACQRNERIPSFPFICLRRCPESAREHAVGEFSPFRCQKIHLPSSVCLPFQTCEQCQISSTYLPFFCSFAFLSIGESVFIIGWMLEFTFLYIYSILFFLCLALFINMAVVLWLIAIKTKLNLWLPCGCFYSVVVFLCLAVLYVNCKCKLLHKWSLQKKKNIVIWIEYHQF